MREIRTSGGNGSKPLYIPIRQANKVGGGRRALKICETNDSALKFYEKFSGPQILRELSRTQRWGLSREIVATYDRKDVGKSNCIGEPFISIYNRDMGIPREVSRYYRDDPVETTRWPRNMTKQYLLGVLHDATVKKTTYRIGTKSRNYSDFLAKEIMKFGVKAWKYKEGKHRNLWIVEFSKTLLQNVLIHSSEDKINYVRGYFDAEGGIAKSSHVRYYLYFAQKNKTDLLQVKQYLEELGIRCGMMHNPSKKVDPNYWRFFIQAKSYRDFATIVGSDHPKKRQYLRVKI